MNEYEKARLKSLVDDIDATVTKLKKEKQDQQNTYAKRCFYYLVAAFLSLITLAFGTPDHDARFFLNSIFGFSSAGCILNFFLFRDGDKK